MIDILVEASKFQIRDFKFGSCALVFKPSAVKVNTKQFLCRISLFFDVVCVYVCCDFFNKCIHNRAVMVTKETR